MDTLDNGIPDCPECGGKGMCPKHLLELLKYESETAQNEYMEVLRKQSRKKETK